MKENIGVIYDLPLFTICKAPNKDSPIQILLASNGDDYTVFSNERKSKNSTEKRGIIMTPKKKSVSKKVGVIILEIPDGKPQTLIEFFFKNPEYEELREKAINSLMKDKSNFKSQAKIVLRSLKHAIENLEINKTFQYSLTSDEQEQEEISEEIRKSHESKKDLYKRLLVQKNKPDEFIIVNRKLYKRDNITIARIKYLRDYKCQLCGTRIQKEDGTFYIEAAHISEKCKGGKEAINNILILCPNHHKEFDFGRRQILKRDDSYIDFLLNGKKIKIDLSIGLE